MQSPDEKTVNEIDRLKRKCNTQIDHIKKLQKQLEQAENALAEYKKNVEENAQKDSRQTDVFSGEIPDVFSLSGLLFRQTFIASVIQEALLDDRKSDLKKRSYKSLEYAVLIPVLEEYCSANSIRISAQKIAQNWADLGLLIRDSRGKITYNFSAGGASTRVVRVNQAALQLISEAWP